MSKSTWTAMAVSAWVIAHVALLSSYFNGEGDVSRHMAPLPSHVRAEWTPREEFEMAEWRVGLVEAASADRDLAMDGPNSGLSLILPIRGQVPGSIREDWVPPRMRGASQAAEL